MSRTADTTHTHTAVYVMCRRGVLSAHATRLLLDNGYNNVFNVQGGLTRWHADVEPAFPVY
jgi:rhodanese-related sulfurtransferase